MNIEPEPVFRWVPCPFGGPGEGVSDFLGWICSECNGTGWVLVPIESEGANGRIETVPVVR
jgi:hypothetical protein